MPKQAKEKKRKPGRPKLAEHEAKGKIVPVRFDQDDLSLVIAASRSSNQTVSDWIRHIARTEAEKLMFKSTLHEAMQSVLLEQPNFTASTSFLADEIAKSGSYERKDGQRARARQISARARNYPRMFELTEPGMVRLKPARD